MPLFSRPPEVSGAVRIVGYSTNSKAALFAKQIAVETLFAAAALGTAFVMLWCFTRSAWIATLGYLQILAALGTAYTLWTMILRLTFFPFLNLVAIFVIIGIGSDVSLLAVFAFFTVTFVIIRTFISRTFLYLWTTGLRLRVLCQGLAPATWMSGATLTGLPGPC